MFCINVSTYTGLYVFMSTRVHVNTYTWLHNFMNLFRLDFLHLTMLRLISLYTLFHYILHEGADGKAFFMCNGLHLVNKGFLANKGEVSPRVFRRFLACFFR